MCNHGYLYYLGNIVWEGYGFSSRKEAEERFQELIDVWISKELPDPPRRWEFWKEDVERPSIDKHVF